MIDWRILFLAFVLDLIVGDPQGAPHPVRWMGRAIEALEPRFRRLPLPLTVSGLLFAAGLIVSTWGAALVGVRWAGKIHPGLGWAVQVLGVYFCLSARDLADSARAVAKALDRLGLDAARQKLAMIVGRDVRRLDEAGAARAAVETVAENFVDGVLSPVFFAVLGGAPLALAYKMVNTLDSMVGYKNQRYRKFGKAAARFDDAANWIPARLSVPVIAAATALLGGAWRNALQRGWSQGRRHTSPNAGYPEAAFAGALGLRLGGPSVYHGRQVDKPFIGNGSSRARSRHIEKACGLMLTAAVISVGAAGFVSFLLS